MNRGDDTVAGTGNWHVTGVIMRKPRVIIFDDDVSSLKLLESSFAGWGYEVFSYHAPLVCPASFGQECNCQAPCADLMISDFLMPQMTGTELFWRQAERGCKVPKKAKAIISYYSEDRLLRLCEDSGYRYFEKPFNYEKLNGWLSACESCFDLSKQLGRRPAEAGHEFRHNIEYYSDSSDLREKYNGFRLIRTRVA